MQFAISIWRICREASRAALKFNYRSHARDIGVTRFKDLCTKHSVLILDDWKLITVGYLSIVEEPEFCRQLVLAFLGKFISTPVSSNLDWAETETLRFARRLMRSFSASELAAHLRLSDRRSRRILHELVERNSLSVTTDTDAFKGNLSNNQ